MVVVKPKRRTRLGIEKGQRVNEHYIKQIAASYYSIYRYINTKQQRQQKSIYGEQPRLFHLLPKEVFEPLGDWGELSADDGGLKSSVMGA